MHLRAMQERGRPCRALKGTDWEGRFWHSTDSGKENPELRFVQELPGSGGEATLKVGDANATLKIRIHLYNSVEQ
jgi:hypothetical protein